MNLPLILFYKMLSHRTTIVSFLLLSEIRSLDSEMQTLVYENYNKFISATDTIRKVQCREAHFHRRGAFGQKKIRQQQLRKKKIPCNQRLETTFALSMVLIGSSRIIIIRAITVIIIIVILYVHYM